MKLKKLLNEAIDNAGTKECPTATQDLRVNTLNRDRAIKAPFITYGPLNVEEPGDYWENIAKKWRTSVEAAKKSNKGTELKGVPKGPAIKRPTYSTKARK